MNIQDINQLAKRTRRYWYEDGFTDIAMGIFALLAGFMFVMQLIVPKNSVLDQWWGLAGPALLLAVGFVLSWGIGRVKSRYTYTRTGYVNFERKGMDRVVRIAAILLLAAVVAAGTVLLNQRFESATLLGRLALASVCWAALFWFLAFHLGLRRYLFLGLWALVLGPLLTALPLTMGQAAAIYMAGLGVGLIISGLFAWRAFDRKAPPPEVSNGSPLG